MAEEKAKKKPVGEVRLNRVRLSFPHVFEPQPGKVDPKTGIVGEPRWNAAFLIPKDTPEGKVEDAKIRAAAIEAKKAKWGEEKNWPKMKAERLCYRDGDREDWDGYEGMRYLSSGRPTKNRDGSENTPPAVVDKDKTPLTAKSGKIYAGCYVNAIVRIWAQDDRDFGKRLNCSLEAVQFAGHGEAFGARPVDPNEAFEDISDEDDGDRITDEEDEDEDLLG